MATIISAMPSLISSSCSSSSSCSTTRRSSKQKQDNNQEWSSSSSSFLRSKASRREASSLLLSSFLPICLCQQPAPANAFGISGPKDWLRDQKKKASRFLLAPIDASRNSLRNAYQLLLSAAAGPNEQELEEVQRLVSSAARDCVPQDRNSFVAFQSSTGVEVCTFKLVVKNASSLLDNKDPVKLEAEAMLAHLVRSFTSLNNIMANEADIIKVTSNREKVADIIMETISSLDRFEKGVLECLQV